MPYPRNHYHWPVGSFVFHAGDAKNVPYLMMKVIGYVGEDLAVTRYMSPQVRWGKDKPLNNHIQYLLDPAAFGYFVPQNYEISELTDLVGFLNRWMNTLGFEPPFWELMGFSEAVCYFREYKANGTLANIPLATQMCERMIGKDPPSQDITWLEGMRYLGDMWTEDRIVEYGKNFRW